MGTEITKDFLREMIFDVNLFFLIEIQLICDVVLVSGVPHNDSVIYSLSQILFPRRLLQNIEYSSLCIQQALVYLFHTQQYVYVNPKLLVYPSPLSPWTSVFCLCICFSFVYMFICIRIHSICLSPVLKGELELLAYMVLGDEAGVQRVLGWWEA